MREIVMLLLREGYVPSWCTACYRKVSSFFCWAARVKRKTKQKEKKSLTFSLPPPSPLFQPPFLRSIPPQGPHRRGIYEDR